MTLIFFRACWILKQEHHIYCAFQWNEGFTSTLTHIAGNFHHILTHTPSYLYYRPVLDVNPKNPVVTDSASARCTVMLVVDGDVCNVVLQGSLPSLPFVSDTLNLFNPQLHSHLSPSYHLAPLKYPAAYIRTSRCSRSIHPPLFSSCSSCAARAHLLRVCVPRSMLLIFL